MAHRIHTGALIYQYPANPQPPPALAYPPNWPRPTNTMAILAIIFAFVFSPLGIVFGFIGRSQIKQTGEQGDGMALAGIIVGFVLLGLSILGMILLFSFAGGTMDMVYTP